MKACIDTSVLVTALVDQLPNHESALACLINLREGDERPNISTHSLAECYATLTALPLGRRISPAEARRLISVNLESLFSIIPLATNDYEEALDRVAARGLSSGVVYDALHLIAAERAACDTLFTFNLSHFHRLSPKQVKILAP